MENIEYANAFYEVLEILKYVDIKDYEKIPQKLMQTLRTYANWNWNFKYDVNKTLDEQNTSDISKAIIANIFKEYWATPIQKEKIIAKEEYDRLQLEKINIEKYNPDKLFKNKETKVETIENSVAIVEYKESIFTKIKNWFKRTFEQINIIHVFYY